MAFVLASLLLVPLFVIPAACLASAKMLNLNQELQIFKDCTVHLLLNDVLVKTFTLLTL